MSSYEENYLDKRPQSLCNMCGKCCRVVTTSTSYKDLVRKAECGDEGALDFLSIFEPYSTLDAAREVDAGVVDNIINLLKLDNPDMDENEVTFYCCKYLLDNNMCSNYENRPTLCRHFPSTPWAIVPPNCGFEGWLFWKREEDKEKVRRAKEELLELKLLKTKTLNPETFKKIEAVEAKINKTIEHYKKYGSEFW